MTIEHPCLSEPCTRKMAWTRNEAGKWQARCTCGYSTSAASGTVATLDAIEAARAER